MFVGPCAGIMMIAKKHTLWVLNPLLLAMMAPAVAQQTDDESMVISASRNNRTVANGNA